MDNTKVKDFLEKNNSIKDISTIMSLCLKSFSVGVAANKEKNFQKISQEKLKDLFLDFLGETVFFTKSI